jgi:hypothetical protein
MKKMLLSVVVLACLCLLASCGYSSSLANAGGPTPQPTARPAPFNVTSVDMAVSPLSINGMNCGTHVTVTYTATFHATASSASGTVLFGYTTNNGRGETPARITFSPGQTSKVYTFTWSGTLPLDHTYPGSGGVQVSSPNHVTSSLVAPKGQCTSGKFQVTSIAMAVSPTSIQGLLCGTSLVVRYTATIHIAPGSSGGPVQFMYTVNNGRGETPARITFNPGETTKTYTFTWSGALPADHTYPGPGGLDVSSPNQLISPTVWPTGRCTPPSAAFQVTSVAMSVSPASIQGLSCGTSVVVTYTATIHVAANGPGGTVKFRSTVNNGRGETSASITFGPGQTVRTYIFTWSGTLPADHTYPGPGGIQVTSPDQLLSSLVRPTGMCS